MLVKAALDDFHGHHILGLIHPVVLAWRSTSMDDIPSMFVAEAEPHR